MTIPMVSEPSVAIYLGVHFIAGVAFGFLFARVYAANKSGKFLLLDWLALIAGFILIMAFSSYIGKYARLKSIASEISVAAVCATLFGVLLVYIWRRYGGPSKRQDY